MQFILNKIKEAYDSKMPFVAYRKPNDKTIFGFFQKNNLLQTITSDFSQAGFVFAPFDSSSGTIFFPQENSTFISDEFYQSKVESNDLTTLCASSKVKHVQIVKKAIEEISSNTFKKVVISRKEIVALTKLDVVEIYSKLLNLYPNAFVYVWFHPQVGLWFGATPESLLEVAGNKFTSMSLAGTQEYKEGKAPRWNPKEIEEQQIVTDYILKKLSGFSNNLVSLKTETVKAGSLMHLKTVIKGELKSKGLFSLINVLHPTPAVCGFPKEKAKAFILRQEGYSRSYYTGFLGELHVNDTTNLFVNLRCMEIINNNAEIYVGGGVTKESVPEKEWKETVAKSKTMRSAL